MNQFFSSPNVPQDSFLSASFEHRALVSASALMRAQTRDDGPLLLCAGAVAPQKSANNQQLSTARNIKIHVKQAHKIMA